MPRFSIWALFLVGPMFLMMQDAIIASAFFYGFIVSFLLNIYLFIKLKKKK